MPATALPTLAPQRLQNSEDVFSAYVMLLRMEKAMLAHINSCETHRPKGKYLMYCRIVGHFFHHVPTDRGLKNLAKEVSLTKGDWKKLLDIGELYYRYTLRIFLPVKESTPVHSLHPSRPPFNNMVDMIKSVLEDTTTDYDAARKKALIRDGFRCVITGAYDYKSAEQFEELMQAAAGENFLLAKTECTYIFPESTNISISGEGSNTVTSAWGVLSRFADRENLLAELNGSGIHRLENLMTMCHDAHAWFDSFELWLEPTEVENQYRLEGALNPGLLNKFKPDRIVTFTTHDHVHLPVPSREYLALHAACAKVANLSGAVEYTDSVLSEKERTLVLSSDGTSGKVLEYAIWAAQSKLGSV